MKSLFSFSAQLVLFSAAVLASSIEAARVTGNIVASYPLRVNYSDSIRGQGGLAQSQETPRCPGKAIFTNDTTGDFLRMTPGAYINVPRVDIYNCDFSFSIDIRMRQTSARQAIIGDWAPGKWSFLVHTPPGNTMLPSVNLRRNYSSSGSDPAQDLIALSASRTFPVNAWSTLLIEYVQATREASIYLNGTLVGTQKSIYQVNETRNSLRDSTLNVFQIGSKMDDVNNCISLDADIRNFVVRSTCGALSPLSIVSKSSTVLAATQTKTASATATSSVSTYTTTDVKGATLTNTNAQPIAVDSPRRVCRPRGG